MNANIDYQIKSKNLKKNTNSLDLADTLTGVEVMVLGSVILNQVYKNLAIANRLRLSCAHNSSRASP